MSNRVKNILSITDHSGWRSRNPSLDYFRRFVEGQMIFSSGGVDWDFFESFHTTMLISCLSAYRTTGDYAEMLNYEKVFSWLFESYIRKVNPDLKHDVNMTNFLRRNDVQNAKTSLVNLIINWNRETIYDAEKKFKRAMVNSSGATVFGKTWFENADRISDEFFKPFMRDRLRKLIGDIATEIYNHTPNPSRTMPMFVPRPNSCQKRGPWFDRRNQRNIHETVG